MGYLNVEKSNAPIGLYRRGLIDPARLKATTVGRQHLVKDILEKLRRRCNKKSGQNHLFIGPRGIGKTHLLSLLEQGISDYTTLRDNYRIIRFPEESNRVLSFADLLLGIIDLLAGMDGNEWQKLHEKLETEEDDSIIIDSVLPRLKHWHRQTGKVLLIMMENLDVLFTRQLKKGQDIHRLRKLLMNNSHIMLIGTAPIFFPALNDVKHPLYDFFDIQLVEDLSQEETLALIQAHLEWDNRDDLLQQFDQLKPRILAMHTLTGGTPRLITMLYELKLITEGNLADIKARFQQMLDRITPFYQERIKELPPQERALLETIALMRSVKRTPVNIAKKIRKPRHQTSVLLKRMTESGYLTVSQNPQDKRSRLYRIKEGFFDIWLAMNESRANRKYLPYLVEFFSLWYGDVQTREKKRQQLREELEQLSARGQKNALDILTYLSEASSKATEKQQTRLELVVRRLKRGSSDMAKTLLQETEKLLPDKPKGLLTWMHDKAGQWAGGEQPSDLVGRMEKIIQYWQQQRAGELEQAARIYHDLQLDFSSHGLHKLHIGLLHDRMKETDDPEQQADLLLLVGNSEKYDGQLSAALATLKRVLDLCIENKNRKLQGTALNNISGIYNARGDYETALKYLQESLAITQEIGDIAGLCATLFNMGHIHFQNKELAGAMQTWSTVYGIAQKINLTQALDALESLAEQLSLDGGLEGWEKLERQLNEK